MSSADFCVEDDEGDVFLIREAIETAMSMPTTALCGTGFRPRSFSTTQMLIKTHLAWTSFFST
jgi:hypothetical protein